MNAITILQALQPARRGGAESANIDWKLLLQIVLTILTAVASALGVSSCISRVM